MRISRSMAAGSVILMLAGTFGTQALAVDFIEAAPKQTKVLVDNDKVRVIHVKNTKGDKIPMHSHPDMVVYIIKGGKIKFTNADGTVRESDGKSGESYFRPAVTHSHDHMSDGEAVVVELKK